MVAFFRRSVEKNVNKAFFLDFFHFCLSAQTRLVDLQKNMVFSLVFVQFIISESFKAIQQFLKIRPLGRAGVARPPLPEGRPTPPRGGEFSKLLNRMKTFRYDEFDKNE